MFFDEYSSEFQKNRNAILVRKPIWREGRKKEFGQVKDLPKI
jgi:hypothetical protein